jgi:hypothetical protein
LKEAIKEPGEFLMSDFSKFDRPPLLHLAFQALDKFRTELLRFPIAGSADDAQKLIDFAISINESLGESKLEEIDKKLLQHFASGSRAVLNPMAAMFGGIVGQEVVKACSGKFHPLYQVRICWCFLEYKFYALLAQMLDILYLIFYTRSGETFETSTVYNFNIFSLEHEGHMLICLNFHNT